MHSSVVACHGGWHTWVAPAVLPHCCLVEVANLLGIRWVLSLLHPGTAQDHSQVHMWTGQPPDSRRKAGMLHQLHSKPLPSVPSGSLTSGTSSWWLQVPLREGTTLGTSRSPGHALVGDHTAWQAAHGWSGDDPNQAHLSHTHTHLYNLLHRQGACHTELEPHFPQFCTGLDSDRGGGWPCPLLLQTARSSLAPAALPAGTMPPLSRAPPPPCRHSTSAATAREDHCGGRLLLLGNTGLRVLAAPSHPVNRW